MKGRKKSRKSGGSRVNKKMLRLLLAIFLFPFALALSLSPELGNLEIPWITVFFVFGAIVGTMAQLYWIRVLLRNDEFYAKFYEMGPQKTHEKFKREILKPHTKNVLPFYLFGILLFIILVFILGVLGLSHAYALPFVLGALEGVPIGYEIFERRGGK